MTIDNPFSTRFIDPKSHTFVFPAGQSLDRIGAYFRENGWWGEITGPRGTGKSTLLHTLCCWAEEQGCTYRFFFLNDQQQHLPLDWSFGPGVDFYAVDGAEQLPGWMWSWLAWHCRRRDSGLLATTHHSLRLPPLYQTRLANAETIRRVVEAIAGPENVPDPDLARQLAAKHSGDIRSVLFELYDSWENEARVSAMVSTIYVIGE